jgi:hypothetical protein
MLYSFERASTPFTLPHSVIRVHLLPYRGLTTLPSPFGPEGFHCLAPLFSITLVARRSLPRSSVALNAMLPATRPSLLSLLLFILTTAWSPFKPYFFSI